MDEEQLIAEIEEIVVPLGFAPSQNLLFCAASRDLVGPYPWVMPLQGDVSLERACTDLFVDLEGGRIREVDLEGRELGDLLVEVVGDEAAARYRELVPGALASAGPRVVESLRLLFAQRS